MTKISGRIFGVFSALACVRTGLLLTTTQNSDRCSQFLGDRVLVCSLLYLKER
jgi:hypothetical protein